MFDRRNSPIHRAALVLDPQTNCPIATGDYGRWFDGTTEYVRNTDGTDVAVGAGSRTYKEAVRLATATALASSDYDSTALTITKHSAAAKLTIDGVDVANGDRVLVKNEGTDSRNGIYTVTNKGSSTSGDLWVLKRAPDCKASNMFEPAFVVPVAEGSVNADTMYEFTADAPFTMDTSSATFSLMPISITYGAGGDMASLGLAATNAAGVSSKVARADHQHAVSQYATGSAGNFTGFTAGSATGAKADSSWVGGTGTTGFTVGDIVTALKNNKILAL